MKTIYYAIQNIIRGKDSTIIKVVSLSLGLFISIILFARVAMELNHDTFYQDHEDLYVVQSTWINKDGKNAPSPYNIYSIGEALMQHFPEQVKSATVIFDMVSNELYHGQEKYATHVITADSLFFQTMGIPLLEGNALELGTRGSIFLSETLARQIFGSENPIGKTIHWSQNKGKKQELTVKGIFTDIPDNVTFKGDAIVSISNTSNRKDWTSGGNYLIMTRLHKNADSDFINRRASTVIGNYIPIDTFYGQFGINKVEVSVTPLDGYHIQEGQVKNMIFTMTLLAIVLLFTATFNYALISISSISHRAKAIGVHKCVGAENGNIFSIFLWETFFIVGTSIIISIFLILNFQEKIEELTDASVKTIFSFKNLWMPLMAIALMFVIGCVLPGKLFTSIPVTQVFRRYTKGKKNWKYPLLFIQFGGAAFLLTFVCILFAQYHNTLNKNLGYNTNRLVYAFHAFDHAQNGLSNLRNLPYVEGAENANSRIYQPWQDQPIKDNNGNIIFWPRVHYAHTDFCQMIGYQLEAGTFPTRKDEMVVNREFVKKMGWTSNGIGEFVPGFGTVTGIIYYSYSDCKEMEPYCVRWTSNESKTSYLHVRLKEPFEENLLRLNEDMKRLYPQEEIIFQSIKATFHDLFRSARIFRDASVIACISILCIMFMGLIGYTNDEVRRRSKEIAIRKINGAEISSILQMLCRDIVIIALPAVVIGTISSWHISNSWISSNFKDVLSIHPLLYIGTGLVVMAFILGTVIIKAWRIANENPVLSIKSE